jgi:sugar transport protein
MSAITGAAMIGPAALSQRVGRRTVLTGTAAAVTVGASLTFAFMVALAKDGAGFLPIAVLAIVASVLVNGPLGTIVTYLNERFPLGVRSSGYGTAYTVSLILPSLYSVWIGLLTSVMPFEYAPVVLIAVGGLLFTAGAWLGPETVTGGTLGSDAVSVRSGMKEGAA